MAIPSRERHRWSVRDKELMESYDGRFAIASQSSWEKLLSKYGTSRFYGFEEPVSREEHITQENALSSSAPENDKERFSEAKRIRPDRTISDEYLSNLKESSGTKNARSERSLLPSPKAAAFKMEGSFTITRFEEGGKVRSRQTPTMRLVCLTDKGEKIVFWGQDGVDTRNIDTIQSQPLPCAVECEYRNANQMFISKFGHSFWVPENARMKILRS